MKKYQIEYLPEAKQDLEEIYNYIAVNLENRPAADRIVREIIRRCDNLKVFPNGYATKLSSHNIAIKFVHSGRYTIAYSVNDELAIVTIYAIKYSRLDLNVILDNCS